jgi:hypothetical protein
MPHSADDWQQMATEHHQAKRANELERIKRKGRRGNKLLGAGIILFALLVFGIGALVALSVHADSQRQARQLFWLFGGGAVTLLTGLAIWKGAYR